jgi:hypothetical protein
VKTENTDKSVGLATSGQCRDVEFFILDAVCELVGHEGRERSLMTSSLCGK